MGVNNRIITGGELCWLHFKLDEPNPQVGDYGYQKAYAPNRSEKIEDGEVYVKVRIKDLMWKRGNVYFNIITVNKDGSEVYRTQVAVDDADRLTFVER